MAVAYVSKTAWTTDDGIYNSYIDSGTFSVAAGDTLVALVKVYGNSSPTVSNTVSSLTWTQVLSTTSGGGHILRMYRAYAATAISNLTVRYSDVGAAYCSPSISVYVLSGADSSAPVGQSSSGSSGATSNTQNLPSGSIYTTVDNSVMVGMASDLDARTGDPTSSNLANTAVDSISSTISGTIDYPTAFTQFQFAATRASGTGSNGWQYVAAEFKPQVASSGRKGWGVVR